tara:strand:+ start:1206 stop:1979 length:774 start_codon:yes stop_codon:yes gene_type:complete
VKITKQQLKQIIEEELGTTLTQEGWAHNLLDKAKDAKRKLGMTPAGREQHEKELGAWKSKYGENEPMPWSPRERRLRRDELDDHLEKKRGWDREKEESELQWSRDKAGMERADAREKERSDREAPERHRRWLQRNPTNKLDKQREEERRKRKIDREFARPKESEHDGYGGTTRSRSWNEGNLTKQQLKQITEEELSSLLSEVGLEHDAFSPEGQRAARRVPTQVTGPAQIIQVKNGESLPLAKVEAGESVMIRFDEE